MQNTKAKRKKRILVYGICLLSLTLTGCESEISAHDLSQYIQYRYSQYISDNEFLSSFIEVEKPNVTDFVVNPPLDSKPTHPIIEDPTTENHSTEEIPTPEIESTTEEPTTEATTEEVTEEPTTEAPEDLYDYSKPVPTTDEMCSDAYFDDAVFIGNSLFDGIKLYCNTSATFYTYTGLNVESVKTKEFVPYKDKNVTALYALKKNKNCSKVYLMFGINEIGWPSQKIVLEEYADLIHTIKRIKPDADIYVNCVLPVSENKASSRKCFSEKSIKEFNKQLQQLCEDEQIYYVKPYNCLANDDGYLDSSVTTDGIHLNVTYTEKWCRYIKYHTVPHSSNSSLEDDTKKDNVSTSETTEAASTDADSTESDNKENKKPKKKEISK